MQGFCGWLYLHSPTSASADVLSRAAGEESSLAILSDKRWAVKIPVKQPSAVSWYQGDGGFSVIEGNPRPGAEEFVSLVSEYGIAKACHIRYRQIGADFLADLRGRFSLAISLDDARILLSVDKAGINSIFYSVSEFGVAFASNLTKLRHCSELDLKMDAQAVYDYLYFQVIPSPKTIYKNVHRLVPGSYLEVVNGNSHVDRYWQLRFRQEQNPVDFASLKSEFTKVLRQCVEEETESASKVGCFLSGGTDSSTLAGMLVDVTQAPAPTFSIGFDQLGFDEMEYARLAARHFGTDHHEYYVTPEDIINLVPDIPRAYGQPFGNSSVIPTYYCAQMARSSGVEKLLGGDGGDELFGGNERYATQVLFSYYERIPQTLRKYLIQPAVDGCPFGERIMPVRKARRYIEKALIPMPGRLQTDGYLNLIGPNVILNPAFLETVDTQVPLRSLEKTYFESRAQHFINKMLALDLKLTLSDNDLPKVSGMCELAGISVGYPFLQEQMLEFSAGLPADMKVRGLKIRYFFKEALRDYLPMEIINKKKHGFGLPFGDWLVSHNGLRDLAFDSLSSLKQHHIVRADFLDDLRDTRLMQHPNYYGGLIWLLMILAQWLEMHSNSSTSGRP